MGSRAQTSRCPAGRAMRCRAEGSRALPRPVRPFLSMTRPAAAEGSRALPCRAGTRLTVPSRSAPRRAAGSLAGTCLAKQSLDGTREAEPSRSQAAPRRYVPCRGKPRGAACGWCRPTGPPLPPRPQRQRGRLYLGGVRRRPRELPVDVAEPLRPSSIVLDQHPLPRSRPQPLPRLTQTQHRAQTLQETHDATALAAFARSGASTADPLKRPNTGRLSPIP